MKNQRVSKFHAILISSLILLSMLGTMAMKAPVPAVVQSKGTSATQLLQFTSGGHVLGFTAQGMYAANGSHALGVDFMNANQVKPQADSVYNKVGKAAQLSQVTYQNLWDGITLSYTSTQGSIYTTVYTISPGANPKDIRLRYNAPLTLNSDGTLSIAFDNGQMTESAPIAWQDIQGKRNAVDVAFRVQGQGVTFSLGAYDPHYVLTVDPSLMWNTFVGGSGNDLIEGMAVDGIGNVYVTGFSDSSWGSPVRAYSGSWDAYVAKMDSSGNLTWNTFLGGSSGAYGSAVVVDGSGNVYVSGWTYSAWGCSPTPCTVRPYTGSADAFVAKLDSAGALVWNTFLGGNGDDNGFYGIALDGSGNIYMGGASNAAWSCSSACTVRAYTNARDAFVVKLNLSGALIWNTFLGGNGDDWGYGFAADSMGNVYVTGGSNADWSCSPAPCTVRAYSAGNDAFAVKLNSSGNLLWNTFLGGIGYDEGQSITVDGTGNVYVTGLSDAAWGSPVRAYTSGDYDAFVVKLSSSGAMTWNTFLGGSALDYGQGIVVDGSGNIYVTGISDAGWDCSPASCTGRAYSSGDDAFAAKLNSSGSLTWNTFLGGSGNDVGFGIVLDGMGTIYVGGISYAGWDCSPTSCTVRAYSGNKDGFVVKLGFPIAISGYVGLAGVTLSYMDGTAKTVTSAADSSYVISVPATWSGTVTPSLTCYTFSPVNRSYSNVLIDQTAQYFTPTLIPGCANINVSTAGADQGTYQLSQGSSLRQSYASLNDGPVQVTNTTSTNVIASERVAYNNGSAWTSFSELMGLPVSQLTTVYVMPWYNNADLNTQLRFGNVGTSGTTVTVTVGGVVQGTYPLTPSQSTRVSYTGLNNGPVVVSSSGGVPIIASERVAYYNGSAWTSFSELMGLPAGQLTSIYVMPWYNNADLNTQLRFGNVGMSSTVVTVAVGGVVQGMYPLEPNQSARASYTGLNNGPVVVASSGGVPIIASERVAYYNGSAWTSYSELMGLPAGQLTTSYVMPWYNNVDLNTQLRFANVGGSSTTVTVKVGGVNQGTYVLGPYESARVSYVGLNNGPMVVSSSGGMPIIASERVAYYNGSAWTSFSELMGFPSALMTNSYVMPWYNNLDLNTQLRFAVP